MSEYDYGNARLRGMRSRLLSRDEITGLINSATVDNMLTALMRTPYKPAVETTLVRLQGLPALMAALREDVAATFDRIVTFYQGEASRLVTLRLRHYTVQNVKTILRGLTRQVGAATILTTVVPIGELDRVQLQTLASASDPRAAVDLMATWQSPLAIPLLEARTTTPNASLQILEQTLERWYLNSLAEVAPGNRVWRTHIQQRVDITNIMIALRLVGLDKSAPTAAERFLPVRHGTLALEQLQQMAQQRDIPSAVAELPPRPYGRLLTEALPTYAATERLSLLERPLQQYRLHAAVRGLSKDPLGIGVPIGYFALKLNEITNLRLIGQALYLKIQPQRVFEQLSFVE